MRLEWTTETPIQPGWYWHRDGDWIGIAIVSKTEMRPWHGEGSTRVVFLSALGSFIERETNGEWAGPIPLPETRPAVEDTVGVEDLSMRSKQEPPSMYDPRAGIRGDVS